MGAVLGLMTGLGLVLIWRSRTQPRTVVPSTPQPSYRKRLLSEAGITGVSSRHLLMIQIIAAVLSGLIIFVAARSVAISVCFVLFGFRMPTAAVRRLRARRMAELREVWPEVVDNLSSAVRAGMPLGEALSALATRGPEQLREVFARFASNYRATGRFSECLDLLKNDLADPVGDRICETLRIAREVGGADLGRVLRTLSAFLREHVRIRAEVEARQSWTVNAARLAVAAPWAVLLLLATQSTALDAYDSFAGGVLLGCGGIACIVAYRVMVLIGRLPVERRVLGNGNDAIRRVDRFSFWPRPHRGSVSITPVASSYVGSSS